MPVARKIDARVGPQCADSDDGPPPQEEGRIMPSTSASTGFSAGTRTLTLGDHMRTRLAGPPEHAGIDRVILAIAEGAVAVERSTRRAALSGMLGSTGEINVQGEIVQRLDALGTDIFVNALRDCGSVAALACEELEEMVHVSDALTIPS